MEDYQRKKGISLLGFNITGDYKRHHIGYCRLTGGVKTISSNRINNVDWIKGRLVSVCKFKGQFPEESLGLRNI